MRRRNPIIVNAYHFLAEAILVFLLMVPFMYYRYNHVLYWDYLPVMIAMCLLFSFYGKITNHISWYIMTAPFFMLLFYLLGFPELLSIIFPILLTWRYIALRGNSELNRETHHIIAILMISIFIFLFTHDEPLFAYLLFSVLIIWGGHITSHFFMHDKDERTLLGKKWWIFVGGFIGIHVSGLIFFLKTWGIVTFIWDSAVGVVTFIVSLILIPLEAVFPSILQDGDWEDISEETGKFIQLGQGLRKAKGGRETPLLEGYTGVVVWICALVLLAFIIIVALRHFRKSFKPISSEKTSYVTYSPRRDNAHAPKRNIFKSLFRAPAHKVRKLIYELERDALKANNGRYAYETLDKWVLRVGFELDTNIYDKVRYGEKEVEHSEIERLQKQLQTIKKHMKL